MIGLALVAGVGTGLGLWLMILGWWPRPPRLDAALDTPDRLVRDTAAASAPGRGAEPEGWAVRWGRPAARWLRGAGLPTASTRRELAAIDKPVEAHLAEQVTAAVLGLLIPPMAAAALTAGGIGVSLGVPIAGSLACSAAGFALPEIVLRADAAKHRAAFRAALSSFLDLVVVALAAGAGIDQALEEAAAVGTGPAYAELRYALAEARLARVPPWDLLARLGRRVAVPELHQLAATLALAGTEGAKIRVSLRSRATALRQQQLADAEGEANTATERMALPITILLAGYLIIIGYPALATVLQF
jgi:Flp pilus assembly protein TadB